MQSHRFSFALACAVTCASTIGCATTSKNAPSADNSYDALRIDVHKSLAWARATRIPTNKCGEPPAEWKAPSDAEIAQSASLLMSAVDFCLQRAAKLGTAAKDNGWWDDGLLVAAGITSGIGVTTMAVSTVMDDPNPDHPGRKKNVGQVGVGTVAVAGAILALRTALGLQDYSNRQKEAAGKAVDAAFGLIVRFAEYKDSTNTPVDPGLLDSCGQTPARSSSSTSLEEALKDAKSAYAAAQKKVDDAAKDDAKAATEKANATAAAAAAETDKAAAAAKAQAAKDASDKAKGADKTSKDAETKAAQVDKQRADLDAAQKKDAAAQASDAASKAKSATEVATSEKTEAEARLRVLEALAHYRFALLAGSVAEVQASATELGRAMSDLECKRAATDAKSAPSPTGAPKPQ